MQFLQLTCCRNYICHCEYYFQATVSLCKENNLLFNIFSVTWLALLPSKILDINVFVCLFVCFIQLKNSLKQYTAPSVLQITSWPIGALVQNWATLVSTASSQQQRCPWVGLCMFPRVCLRSLQHSRTQDGWMNGAQNRLKHWYYVIFLSRCWWFLYSKILCDSKVFTKTWLHFSMTSSTVRQTVHKPSAHASCAGSTLRRSVS